MLSKYFKIKTKTKEFDEALRQTMDEIKDKRVLLYGAGKGFLALDKKYHFNKNLNVVAIADMKFKKNPKKTYRGIKAIAPKQILDEDYDVILISNEQPKDIIKYINRDLKIKNKEVKTIFTEKYKNESNNFNHLYYVNFEKQLQELKQKSKNQTIMLYGEGDFLKFIYQLFDLSELNIIGISNKQFRNHKDNETFLGYKVYAPDEIKKINPDYLVVTDINYRDIIEKIYINVIQNSDINLILPLMRHESLFIQYLVIMFSGLFDRNYYLKNYGDKLNFIQKLFPMWHYLTKGWKWNYNPSDKFDAVYFYSENLCIGQNPLYHYIRFVVKYGTFLNPRNYYPPEQKTIDKYIKAKSKRGKSKKVMYTCLTGGYDNLDAIKSHRYVDSSWDYVCFTDNEEYIKMKQFGIWEIRPLEYTALDSARNNRWHKMHPHILFPNYDESVYIDTNINILSNRIFKQLKKWKKDLLLPKRLEHQCIYEEYKWVYSAKVDTRSLVRKEWQVIKQAGMPRKYGACECNLIYRKHKNPQIIKLMEDWWHFVENYSRRDQLAFPYVMWKNKLKIKDYSMPNLKPYYKDYCFFKHIK